MINLHSQQQCRKVPFFRILANTLFLVFWLISILKGVRWWLMWFWVAFLWWLVMISIFSCAYWLSVQFLREIYIQILCSHFNRVVWFWLILSCESSIRILNINLLDLLFENIFFHSLSCLLILLMVSFAVLKVFSLT